MDKPVYGKSIEEWRTMSSLRLDEPKAPVLPESSKTVPGCFSRISTEQTYSQIAMNKYKRIFLIEKASRKIRSLSPMNLADCKPFIIRPHEKPNKISSKKTQQEVNASNELDRIFSSVEPYSIKGQIDTLLGVVRKPIPSFSQGPKQNDKY